MDDVPLLLIHEVQQMQELLRSRMDYGEHNVTYLAAMLDPR